ncbi:LysM peptidoglycan-binding domain-containing protein [Nocardioides sp. WG-D5]|uniref:LysM peptidoglycan-binding domain-containing protein n=1 Tax=Nocardioides luteus TaxID=1844 RepID=UPI0002028917|nr:LysM peptidoglycan-binding domain-containing protein [Nocardioides luteus]EGD40948.1 peptidoglycan-binding LysM [Nocardioidaceae bacterium Broad-1]MBG6098604.1 Tfp pilus assembly protein FimV [Nocardioides luteus]
MSATVYVLPVAEPPRPVREVRRSTVRLTRRGRIVVFAFALVVLFGIALIGARVAFAVEDGADKSPAPSAHTMVVGDGDTLWDISAEAVAGTDASIREMEQRIKELNSLESSMLVSGQTLIIPTAP